MKTSTFLKGVAALATLGAISIGATYATSLVTPQTTICVKIYGMSSNHVSSLSIAPYYNNKALGSDIGTPSEGGSCVKVSRDWLMGAAQPGTSFFVTGKDKNNYTHLLESRDIAMLKDIKNLKDKAWIVLTYDIKAAETSDAPLLIGSVTSELHIYDALGVESVKPQKGIHRSTMKDVYALDTMRQIGATKYTRLLDFKGKDNVTREQAAKFFVMTWQATHSGAKIPTTTGGCGFGDIKKIDPTLLESVKNACQLGLMKGSAGNFNPQNNITLAEAVTVLMRMQYGRVDEGRGGIWYQDYFNQAYSVELFDHFAYNPHMNDGNDLISREMIAFLIRRLLEINNIQLKFYSTI